MVPLDLGSTCVREEIEHLQATWTRNKGAALPAEKTAMARLFDVSAALHLMGAWVYRHGRLIGYSIIELLSGGYAMGHFAKCDTQFSGITHYLYQATARAMSDRGCRYLNMQEDLGITGLRTFKMLLRPIAFLKKYAVTCRAACTHQSANGCSHIGNHGSLSLPILEPGRLTQSPSELSEL